MSTAPILFGTDGVRGIAGEFPLQKPFVRKLGAAAAALYRQEVRDRKPKFILGRDTRGSGPWIAQAFAEGLPGQTNSTPLKRKEKAKPETQPQTPAV